MDGFLTSEATGAFLLGITQGVVYSLVALSLVLIWRSTHVLNFAQGAIATLATYFGMELLAYHIGYWWCVALSVAAGMVLGALTEQVIVRPLYGKPEINPLVVLVGLLLAIEAIIGVFWGTTTRPIPVPFSFVDWQLAGKPVLLSPNNVYQIVAAVAVTLFITLLFRFTNLGLQLRASALAPDVSRLLGVRVGRMLTLGWVLACGVGAVSAVIFASSGYTAGIAPSSMESPFVYGFIAAVIGGLDSPGGALSAGIAIGLADAYVTTYYNSNDNFLVVLGLLVVVLMIRPQGLFTRRLARRV
jgi:branched-chain amino acid transport system permease protein